MKKIIALLLSVLLVFGACTPVALAQDTKIKNLRGSGKVPVIRICGDGQELIDAEGNPILNYKGLLGIFNEDGEDGEDGEKDNVVLESVINIVLPFLVEGLLTDNWDPYYDALYKEISELFENSLLDADGNAQPGSGNTPDKIERMKIDMTKDRSPVHKNYGGWTYQLFYDWRLDPWETADKLNEYIKGVKAATGMDRVAIQGSCLGSSVVLSYVQKYGTDDICYLGLDISVSGGAEILSHPVSGKFNLDSEALERMLLDFDAIGYIEIDDLIKETIDLVAATGVIELLGEQVKQTIYEKLVYGVTSSLALSTFYTFPTYWAAVQSEDYEEAKEYIFGPEGSEKREEYAGLIAKLDNYDKEVRSQIPEILSKADDDENCALAIFAKYGMQIAPIVQNTDAVGDQFASLTNASFGATTSTIFDTLSDEYIAQRVAEGKGKYISPDKQVDASTCLYPDYTWIIKGASHSKYVDIESCMPVMIAENMYLHGKQLTVDDFECGQYVIFDYKTADKTAKMTEENCDTYYWKAEQYVDPNENKAEYAIRLLIKLISWLIDIIPVIVAGLEKVPAEKAPLKWR